MQMRVTNRGTCPKWDTFKPDVQLNSSMAGIKRRLDSRIYDRFNVCFQSHSRLSQVQILWPHSLAGIRERQLSGRLNNWSGTKRQMQLTGGVLWEPAICKVPSADGRTSKFNDSLQIDSGCWMICHWAGRKDTSHHKNTCHWTVLSVRCRVFCNNSGGSCCLTRRCKDSEK